MFLKAYNFLPVFQMKKSLKIFAFLMMLLVSTPAFVSCSSDKDDEPEQNYAAYIVGVYTGSLTSGNEVLDDAYVVKIDRISDKMVSMEAKFFPDDESVNFNVSYNNKVYTLSTSNVHNMTVTVTGKTLLISYLNNAGSQTTFSGSRD